MTEYNRINISEGTDTDKTNTSKECDIYHYWYFLDKNYKYEPYLRNGCHALMQKPITFNDVALVSVKGSDYRIHFWHMSKDVAASIMKNSNLNEKSGLKFCLSDYN